MGPASSQPYGVRNFEVSNRFLEIMCTTAVVLNLTYFAIEEKEDEDDEEDDNGDDDDDVYDTDMSILILYPFLLEIFRFMRADCNIKSFP